MNGTQKKMNKPTRTYDQFEIVKVPFPFSDVNSSKIRPALVLTSAKQFNAKIGLSVLAMITSVKIDRNFWPGDVSIENLDVAGLPVPSIVRMKLFTLDHRIILDRLGTLSGPDRLKVQEKLREIFCI